MADSAASTQSRTPRTASAKRRATPVSTETENKLARAARSAQRLAQLSDVARDDNTLDLFPDDPTRATLEAMNIDVRQGTLHGFELPDVVLAAVGALDSADSVPAEARTARRAPRAAKHDEAAPVAAQLSGLESDGDMAGANSGTVVVSGVAAAAAGLVAEDRAAIPALTPASAAASVARSVTALRQAAEPVVAPSSPDGDRPAAGGKTSVAPQRFVATFSKAAAASGDASAVEASDGDANEDIVGKPDAVVASASAFELQGAQSVNPSTNASPDPFAGSADSTSARSGLPSGAVPSHEPARADATAANAARTTPELDRARATAFADTVDALYGVIADQRRAATDHSRRMKWMLSIVVGALLATVAIGVTQTVLLMRLTRETTAQQHRIEQMMQNQQAAMASLLDTHLAMATATAAAASAAPAPVTARQLQASQPGASPSPSKRSTRAQHAHKPKAANAH